MRRCGGICGDTCIAAREFAFVTGKVSLIAQRSSLCVRRDLYESCAAGWKRIMPPGQFIQQDIIYYCAIILCAYCLRRSITELRSSILYRRLTDRVCCLRKCGFRVPTRALQLKKVPRAVLQISLLICGGKNVGMKVRAEDR